MGELTPYLAVRDGRAAIDWYVEHLGATVTFEPIVMPDGRIGHVELEVCGAGWMLADEHPELQAESPAADRGAAVTLHLGVDRREQVDEIAAGAVAGGGTLDREPEDGPHGRIAVLRDPFGHRWMLNHSV